MSRAWLIAGAVGIAAGVIVYQLGQAYVLALVTRRQS